MTIEKMIENTIGKEGKYSNNAADKGGETMWGITIAVARANGYMGPMKDLPRDKAVAIYRQEYAIKPGFAAVAEVSPAVGEELFDTGVNMGQSIPALWFQQCLNAFNNRATLYPDIAEDGSIGPKTIATFRQYLKTRGALAESVMLKALNALQGARYIELSRSREANETFTFGWLANRVGF